MSISILSIYRSTDPVDQSGKSSLLSESKILPANTEAVYLQVTYRWTVNSTTQIASFNFNGSPISASPISRGRTGGGGFFVETWKCTTPPSGVGGSFEVIFSNSISAPQIVAYAVDSVDFVLGDIGTLEVAFDGGDEAAVTYTPQFDNSLILLVGAVGDPNRSPVVSITSGWTVDENGTIPHGNPAAGGSTYWAHKIGSSAGVEETVTINLTPQTSTGSGRVQLIEVVAAEDTGAEGTATITGGGTLTAVGEMGADASVVGGGDLSAIGEKGAEALVTLNGGGVVGVEGGKTLEGDPHYDKVIFLSHFDGENGALTAVDHSPLGNTITLSGPCEISTANPLFGTAAYRGTVDTTQAIATVGGLPADFHFTNKHFTVDAAFSYLGGQTTLGVIVAQWGDPGEFGWNLSYNPVTGFVEFYWTLDGSIDTLDVLQYEVGIIAPGYHRVRVTHDGEFVRMWFDGDHVDWDIIGGAIYSPNLPVTIGNDSGTNNFAFSGDIEEVRLTLDQARSTGDGNISVETEPFPNQSGIETDKSGSATLSGGGAITASGSIALSSSLTITGNGVITSTGNRASFASPAVLGNGVVTATSFKSEVEEANIVGGGLISSVIAKNSSGSIVISGTGTITAVTEVGSETAVIITGGGTTSASGSKSTGGSFTISGGGNVTPETSTQRSGSITLTGGGAISLQSHKDAPRSLIITGGGSVTASGQMGALRSIEIAAGGLITSMGEKSIVTAVTVEGGGSISASGSGGKIVVVEGGGDITVSTTPNKFGDPLIDGKGNLTAEGSKSISLPTTISGDGSISATTFKSEVEEATLNGGGEIIAAVASHRSGSIEISGNGEIIADGAPAGTANITIEGNGDLTASGSKSTNQSAVLSDTGQLSATVGKGVSGSITVQGEGAISCSIVKGGLTVITLQGAGETQASGQSGRVGQGSITANDNSTGTGSKGAIGTLTGSGDGSLASLGVANRIGSVIISGAGLLVVDADKDPPGSFLSEESLMGTYSTTIELTGTHGRVTQLDGLVRKS